MIHGSGVHVNIFSAIRNNAAETVRQKQLDKKQKIRVNIYTRIVML